MSDSYSVIVSSFYKFVDLPFYEELKDPLLQMCKDIGLKGTILLASEGINGSVSGKGKDIEKFYENLAKRDYFTDLIYKENFCSDKPFEKMKVRLKKEIVAMGEPDVDMNIRGGYIKPENWDEFIAREDVKIIDTRNNYEFEIGTFEGAINPQTETFREFPKWFKDRKKEFEGKKVAMFCTGGIRCEKSTAYLKKEGIDEVFHLEGGILNYFNKTNNGDKKWHGDCFVFDDRCSVNDKLEPANIVCSKCKADLNGENIKYRKNQKKFFCDNCFVKEGY